MTIHTQFEKDGRWVATIPEVPGASGHGRCRCAVDPEIDAGLDFVSCRTETLAVRLEFFQPFINAVPYSTKCGLVVARKGVFLTESIRGGNSNQPIVLPDGAEYNFDEGWLSCGRSTEGPFEHRRNWDRP